MLSALRHVGAKTLALSAPVILVMGMGVTSAQAGLGELVPSTTKSAWGKVNTSERSAILAGYPNRANRDASCFTVQTNKQRPQYAFVQMTSKKSWCLGPDVDESLLVKSGGTWRNLGPRGGLWHDCAAYGPEGVPLPVRSQVGCIGAGTAASQSLANKIRPQNAQSCDPVQQALRAKGYFFITCELKSDPGASFFVVTEAWKQDKGTLTRMGSQVTNKNYECRGSSVSKMSRTALIDLYASLGNLTCARDVAAS